MNDEVSVAQLHERAQWPEAPSAARSRFGVVAVMLAVVLGCVLAALLVHIGAEEQRADSSDAAFNMPHGPKGGLAGGGVPPTPEQTEVTGTSTSITVTNEAPPTERTNELPWITHHQRTNTVTVTGSVTTSVKTTESAAPPARPSGDKGGSGSTTSPHHPSTPTPSHTTTQTSPPCVLNLICLPAGH